MGKSYWFIAERKSYCSSQPLAPTWHLLEEGKLNSAAFGLLFSWYPKQITVGDLAMNLIIKIKRDLNPSTD